MDPTTTLFTFMFRRDRGQWRGCYTFKDITREGDTGRIPKRNGGLKMGHTYYYYYELDGTSETHDPSQPSTNMCPYLPGQTVNTLFIPVEQSRRKRSASLTSLRDEDFKTMDPASKFVSPRPAPTPPEPSRRLGTAPLRTLQQKRPARSPSPSSRWMSLPRKFFSRKLSSSSLKDTHNWRAEDERSLRSEGSRSRDISPESLRRFLVDDTPIDHEQETCDRPTIDIPEDIVEENEDDENFATSAVSETMEFAGLSPPPQRAVSPAMSMASMRDAATAVPGSSYLTVPPVPTRAPPRLPTLDTDRTPGGNPEFPLSALRPQHVPESPDSHCPPDFELSEGEEDDDTSGNDEDPPDNNHNTTAGHQTSPFARHLTATLSTYSLPRTAGTEGRKLSVAAAQQQPAVVAGAGAAVGPLMLASPIPDAGLEELVSELGWMADVIREEYV
ncbi:hypothetical protein N657DRAFT_572852 [Parathielavia appendiculata]|uniref:Uncharacterized protein n=1 Tax=Parathielavia appendiculata TaxID=2587402 RepID=A0AAN6TZW5_9PEZI|nr:hypothetical protein N657DRAFT_572852 [Parathielavia appendiculata]